MNLWRQLRLACKQAFCHHQWSQSGSHRCAITRADLSVIGEVTLNLYECQKCGADLVVPSDRTYRPTSKN